MSIKPKGTVLYFPTLGIDLRVDSVVYTPDVELFDRPEFSAERQRQVKEVSGAKPQFIDLYGGLILQATSTCTTSTTRPIGTDDANIDNIKKRWDIRRYRITGSTSLDEYVNILSYTALTHKGLMAKYQTHLAEAASMDISITELLNLQGDSFSYLTSTGLAMYGDAITPMGLVNGSNLSGSSTLHVNIASSLQVGQSLLVNRGTGTAEVVTVNSINVGAGTVGTLSATYAHAVNEPVQLYETNMLITEFSPEVERVISTATNFTVRKVWQLTIESRALKSARA